MGTSRLVRPSRLHRRRHVDLLRVASSQC
ncbi:putative leader peptide [Luteipulveratus halotolerans]